MSNSKRSVLITGCSDGGMGSTLAQEFHKAGFHVYATARDVSKMQTLAPLGIETIPLDIASPESIQACLEQIGSLDILVNNAGTQYPMPITDLSLAAGKQLFDANLWGHIAMIQAFLPHLRKSTQNPIIVNHTSTGAGISIPFQAVYNASKAALSRLSDTLRLELRPFGIAVVELRTGGVKTNFVTNVRAKEQLRLPDNSIFAPARRLVEEALTLGKSEEFMKMTAEEWARGVVGDLVRDSRSRVIWRGDGAFWVWLASFLPATWLDVIGRRLTGLDEIEKVLKMVEKEKAS